MKMTLMNYNMLQDIMLKVKSGSLNANMDLQL